MARKSKIEPQINLVATADVRGIEKFQASLRQTELTLKKFQVGLTAATKGIEIVGRAMKQALTQSIEFAAQIKDIAGASGMGTTELQVLGRVAAVSGSSMEDMSKAVLKLTKSTQDAANGNKQLSDRFARLGIDVTAFKSLAPERQMERLGLAVNAAKDKQAALAEVMALVGQDAGPKLMESLRKLGTEGYDTLAKKASDSGEILSGSAIDSLDRAGQAFKDLGHWFKVMTGEIAGAAFAVKDAITEAISGPATASIWAAVQKYGKDSMEAATAYAQVAQEKFAQGDRELAERLLANTEATAAQVREALAQVDQLSRIKGATAQDWAELNRATLPILKRGPEAAREWLASLEAVREQFAKIETAEAEASGLATAAAAAEAAKAAEAARLSAQKAGQEARIAEEKAFIKRREGVLKALADMDAQIAEDALKAQAAAQARALAEVQRTISQFDFDSLAPSEQLRSQTEAFRDQAAQLYEIGKLGAEEWERAQAQVNERLREADDLLKGEQQAAALAALSEHTKELLADFDALDAKLEGELTAALTDFATTGQADMKKLGQSILNDVIKAMLKALVIKPLLTGIGNMFGGLGGAAGGAGGGIFGSIGKGLLGGLGGGAIPARASGGPVTGAKPYLVGERGPELFIPPTSGTIIDANKTADALAGDTATGGDRGPQNVYQIDARGADAGAVTRLEAALFKLAGPGVVEKRARAADADRQRRG